MNAHETGKKLQLSGIHHLTAVTGTIRSNRAFYTDTLGMRLVKKTVNQDDVSAYHLFYADGEGNPGTDVTFFDWPAAPERRGTSAVARTGLRVASGESLRFFQNRLAERGILTGNVSLIQGRESLDFEDAEGQRLRLTVESKETGFTAWEMSPVSVENQIRGLGPITLSVPVLDETAMVLTDVLNMRSKGHYYGNATDGSSKEATFHVFEMGEGGAGSELHIAEEPFLNRTRHGAGGVHHVAFRVPSFEEYDEWNQRLNQLGVNSSGPIDRYYFKSLYFREPGGVLFELATDGPGFAADEPVESLGERLALPPFLEARRATIQAGLKAI